MRAHREVLVIGSGVCGLATAIRLAEAGLAVRVQARQLPRETTSAASAASWAPYLITDDRVTRWAGHTRRVLTELATIAGAGVRLVRGLEAARTYTPAPRWAREIADFRPSTPTELPAGFTQGWWYTTPVLDMPTHLDYLVGRLTEAGGKLEQATVGSLAYAVTLAPIVVNCAGLGARELADDHLVTPTRGQLLVVENPGVHEFFVEHDETAEPTYFLPQGDHVVLGGSAEPGRIDLGPDPDIAAGILRRCTAIQPRFARARVLGHRVGLRPSRPRVRLAKTTAGPGYVIHNYGHGGAGVTVSWGCAADVLALVAEI